MGEQGRFPRGQSSRSVNLTTHLYVMSRLRMSGAVPSLPYVQQSREEGRIYFCLTEPRPKQDLPKHLAQSVIALQPHLLLDQCSCAKDSLTLLSDDSLSFSHKLGASRSNILVNFHRISTRTDLMPFHIQYLGSSNNECRIILRLQ